jgi:hypothetical protein
MIGIKGSRGVFNEKKWPKTLRQYTFKEINSCMKYKLVVVRCEYLRCQTWFYRIRFVQKWRSGSRPRVCCSAQLKHTANSLTCIRVTINTSPLCGVLIQIIFLPPPKDDLKSGPE